MRAPTLGAPGLQPHTRQDFSGAGGLTSALKKCIPSVWIMPQIALMQGCVQRKCSTQGPLQGKKGRGRVGWSVICKPMVLLCSPATKGADDIPGPREHVSDVREGCLGYGVSSLMNTALWEWKTRGISFAEGRPGQATEEGTR